jgi:hypothetical protein
MVVLPSGKRLHNYGKSPFLMGKSTISTGPFSSSQTVTNYQRVPFPIISLLFTYDFPKFTQDVLGNLQYPGDLLVSFLGLHRFNIRQPGIALLSCDMMRRRRNSPAGNMVNDDWFHWFSFIGLV